MARIKNVQEDDERFSCTQGCRGDLGDVWETSEGELFHNENGEHHEVVLREEDPREKGDDDGVEYADPGDELEDRWRD